MEALLASYAVVPEDRRVQAEYELSDLFMELSKEFPGIENVESFIVPLNIRGLILLDLSKYTSRLSAEERLKLKKRILELFERAKQEGRVLSLLKVIPFDRLVRTDLNEIRRVAEEFAPHVKGPWKVVLRRRAGTPFERKEIIQAIASVIKEPVNLTSPNYVVYVDTLGPQFTGMSLFSREEARMLRLR